MSQLSHEHPELDPEQLRDLAGAKLALHHGYVVCGCCGATYTVANRDNLEGQEREEQVRHAMMTNCPKCGDFGLNLDVQGRR
jgi:hypothetical protein